MNWCCRSNRVPFPPNPKYRPLFVIERAGQRYNALAKQRNSPDRKGPKRWRGQTRAIEAAVFFYSFHSSSSFWLWEEDFVMNASQFFSSQKKSKKIMMAQEVNKIVFSFCDSFVSRNINHYRCSESRNQGRQSSSSWIENKRLVSHQRTFCLPRGSTPHTPITEEKLRTRRSTHVMIHIAGKKKVFLFIFELKGKTRQLNS